MPEIEAVYNSLDAYCRARDYAGYDPFDGLNSAAFQATPFRHSRTARLLWTQLLKRSPINLRRPLLIPSQQNPKAIALFALAAVSRFRALRTSEALREARARAEHLISLRAPGWSGAAWGYNFDWQGRAFFAPKGTPTIVPTAFAVRALVETAKALELDEPARTARSACEFITRDLQTSADSEDEMCFSYSPLDKTRVFNASLLAAESLAAVNGLRNEPDMRRLATRATTYVLRQQRADGSWSYGADDYQSWVDNSHTAYILTSLARLKQFNVFEGQSEDLENAIKRGYNFWVRNFFDAAGAPGYYADKRCPVEAHSAAAAIVACLELCQFENGAMELAEKIARWSIENLRDQTDGFFFYQRRKYYTSRISYMRWSQAWMLYALARLMEERQGR